MFLSIHCLKKKKDYSLLLKSIYLLTYSVCTSLSSGAQGLQSCLQHVGSSSLTRGGTQAPALGAWSLSRWTTRNSSEFVCLFLISSHCNHKRPSEPFLKR